MFLQLNHQKLDVFVIAKSFTLECYRFSKILPSEERFNMVQQIRRAALSVYLNIAEGCSRKSVAERKRFFEISRGSIVEIDAVLDLSEELNYSKKNELENLGVLMQRTFGMLTKMI
jgi:four helix bundle protein